MQGNKVLSQALLPRISLLGNPVNNLLERFGRKVHRAFIGLNYTVDDAAAGKEAD